MDNVTGTINKTVVTLSKNADPTAVNRDSNNKMRIGFPPSFCRFNGHKFKDA